MALFLERMKPLKQTRILDVGGYPWCWLDSRVPLSVTILNLHILPGLENQYKDRCKLVIGDATRMQFQDQQFDIVFSNSVIEHLGTYQQQEKFAKEVRRVGRDLWIQTPAKCFFFEPHLLTPFIHWLPKQMQISLARSFTVWGWITKPSKQTAVEYVDELRLLNETEMRDLFQDCEIVKEKIFGLTKSYIAVRRTTNQKSRVLN
jgi:2-polyprenyl-3-methyl-5-hydroxy-6-metoxy-1,4-benzoquinol methylase